MEAQCPDPESVKRNWMTYRTCTTRPLLPPKGSKMPRSKRQTCFSSFNRAQLLQNKGEALMALMDRARGPTDDRRTRAGKVSEVGRAGKCRACTAVCCLVPCPVLMKLNAVQDQGYCAGVQYTGTWPYVLSVILVDRILGRTQWGHYRLPLTPGTIALRTKTRTASFLFVCPESCTSSN
jgi:hypothetical protein